MAYNFNPTAGESTLLQQIAQRESGGNYSAANPDSTASGAYQFIDSTWQMAAQATGVGTQYASAAAAPSWMQDTNALWLLRKYGPNSTVSWAESGPYFTGVTPISTDGSQPLIDLSGGAASTDTASIMNQLDLSSIDFSSSPGTAVALVLGVAAIAFLISR